ncbi:hypothetical protein GCM10007874_00050 [Labrys miyagiensis]|uniref:Uncharacterized protein n=1 Tax=Labrys miyagiensis TaxID=346912 RepID=A0ABQ6CDW6_9HYPH|nr:hypothetical protein [Labrys miyagiensis]GLS16990.1 hypothetical protein GCM10007874_00050 [Labrys miyagiensis]
MKRSRQLLMVYAELRRALGGSFSASDILELAERLTDLASYRHVIDRCHTTDAAVPGLMPLDRAFGDGGWALLCEAYAGGMMGDDADPDYSWQPRRRAAHFMENWA